jgi:hypothetical protein
MYLIYLLIDLFLFIFVYLTTPSTPLTLQSSETAKNVKVVVPLGKAIPKLTDWNSGKPQPQSK